MRGSRGVASTCGRSSCSTLSRSGSGSSSATAGSTAGAADGSAKASNSANSASTGCNDGCSGTAAGCAAGNGATSATAGGSASVWLSGFRLCRRDKPFAHDRRRAGGNQQAVAAVVKIDPLITAGRKHAARRAKTLQPLQPDGAACRRTRRKPRDLTAMLVGRSENSVRKRCTIGRAEHAGAGRIGPQDSRAVRRPQPGGQGARRVGRQSRIA